MKLTIGDFVHYVADNPAIVRWANEKRPLGFHGLVIETNVTYAGKEVNPPLATVLWDDGTVEDVYEDEVVVLGDTCVMTN
jgi:hypothetical protein